MNFELMIETIKNEFLNFKKDILEGLEASELNTEFLTFSNNNYEFIATYKPQEITLFCSNEGWFEIRKIPFDSKIRLFDKKSLENGQYLYLHQPLSTNLKSDLQIKREINLL